MGRTRGFTKPVTDLLAGSTTTVTASWVDMGSEITTGGADHIGLFIDFTINSTNNFRVRALAKHTSADTDEYTFPIRAVSASDVKVEDEYIEFNVDTNSKFVLSWDLNCVVPYAQFQISAGTVGTTAAVVNDAHYTLGYSG